MYEIFWTDEAQDSYEETLELILSKWPIEIVLEFDKKLEAFT